MEFMNNYIRLPSVDIHNRKNIILEWHAECEHDYPHNILKDDIEQAIRQIVESAPEDPNADPYGGNPSRFDIIGFVNGDTETDFFGISGFVLSAEFPNQFLLYPNEFGCILNMRLIVDNSLPQPNERSRNDKKIYVLYAIPFYRDHQEPHVMIRISYTKMI